jgi:peptidoglycan/LPS O-acetylase OafA/YrhL
MLLAWLGTKTAQKAAVASALAISCWRLWALSHSVLPGVAQLQRTDLRLDAFFVPCFLAISLRSEEWRERARRWMGPLTVAALLGILFLMRQIHIASDTFSSFRYLVQSCALPLVIVSTVLRPATLMARLLELAPIRWVGRVSYSIYLWQMPFFNRGGWIASHTHSVPAKLAALTAVATLSYYLIERPLIRIGRRYERSVLPAAAPRAEDSQTQVGDTSVPA